MRTAGVTNEFGDWSIQRTIDMYAPPNIQLYVTNQNGRDMETLTQFPFNIRAVTGPTTQTPIGYYVTITANTGYETVDDIGNNQMVSEGDTVYSKYFDIICIYFFFFILCFLKLFLAT